MKIKLTLGLMLTTISAMAQDTTTLPECVTTYENELTYQKGSSGSAQDILGAEEMGVYINFSQAKIEFWPIEKYLKKEQLDWATFYEKYVTSYEAKFIKDANRDLREINLKIVSNKVTDYMLRITPIYIDDDADMKAVYEIINTKTCKVECRFDFEADGGNLGTTLSLINDAFKDAGEEFVEKFYKMLKKH